MCYVLYRDNTLLGQLSDGIIDPILPASKPNYLGMIYLATLSYYIEFNFHLHPYLPWMSNLSQFSNSEGTRNFGIFITWPVSPFCISLISPLVIYLSPPCECFWTRLFFLWTISICCYSQDWIYLLPEKAKLIWLHSLSSNWPSMCCLIRRENSIALHPCVQHLSYQCGVIFPSKKLKVSHKVESGWWIFWVKYRIQSNCYAWCYRLRRKLERYKRPSMKSQYIAPGDGLDFLHTY